MLLADEFVSCFRKMMPTKVSIRVHVYRVYETTAYLCERENIEREREREREYDKIHVGIHTHMYIHIGEARSLSHTIISGLAR